MLSYGGAILVSRSADGRKVRHRNFPIVPTKNIFFYFFQLLIDSTRDTRRGRGFTAKATHVKNVEGIQN